MPYEIIQGLDLPISGQPVQDIRPGPQIRSVGLIGDDYIGMRPTMLVKVGDAVKLGQPVFADKKTEGVIYTSPASGMVRSINRGEKRKFLSIVIDVKGDAEVTFKRHSALDQLDAKAIQDQLVKSGMWSSFRTRPFSKVPVLDTEPHSIFVTAMDTIHYQPNRN